MCGERVLRATGKGMEGILTSNFVPIVYKLLVNDVNLSKCPQLVAMLKDF